MALDPCGSNSLPQMGQRIIDVPGAGRILFRLGGRLRFALGLGFHRLPVAFALAGRTACSVGGGGLVGRGRLFVRIAAIVGQIEARSFENDATSGAKQTAELFLAALGALLERDIADRLESIKAMVAGVAFVIVGGHKGNPCSLFDVASQFRRGQVESFCWGEPVETNTCAGRITRSYSL